MSDPNASPRFSWNEPPITPERPSIFEGKAYFSLQTLQAYVQGELVKLKSRNPFRFVREYDTRADYNRILSAIQDMAGYGATEILLSTYMPDWSSINLRESVDEAKKAVISAGASQTQQAQDEVTVTGRADDGLSDKPDSSQEEPAPEDAEKTTDAPESAPESAFVPLTFAAFEETVSRLPLLGLLDISNMTPPKSIRDLRNKQCVYRVTFKGKEGDRFVRSVTYRADRNGQAFVSSLAGMDDEAAANFVAISAETIGTTLHFTNKKMLQDDKDTIYVAAQSYGAQRVATFYSLYVQKQQEQLAAAKGDPSKIENPLVLDTHPSLEAFLLNGESERVVLFDLSGQPYQPSQEVAQRAQNMQDSLREGLKKLLLEQARQNPMTPELSEFLQRLDGRSPTVTTEADPETPPLDPAFIAAAERKEAAYMSRAAEASQEKKITPRAARAAAEAKTSAKHMALAAAAADADAIASREATEQADRERVQPMRKRARRLNHGRLKKTRVAVEQEPVAPPKVVTETGHYMGNKKDVKNRRNKEKTRGPARPMSDNAKRKRDAAAAAETHEHT